jgi:hypothetical protein
MVGSAAHRLSRAPRRPARIQAISLCYIALRTVERYRETGRRRLRLHHSLLEQIPEILQGQRPAERFFAQYVLGQVALSNLQLTDFVLDRVADQ